MDSKGILCRCYYAVYDIMSFQYSQITESDRQKEGDVRWRGRVHCVHGFRSRVIGASHITEWGPNNTHWAKPLLTCFSKRTWSTDVTSAFAMKIFLAWKWNESWTTEIHEAQVLCGPVSLSNFYKDFLSILWAMKIVGEAVQPAVGHRLSTLLGNIQQRWGSSATSWQIPWTLGRVPPQVVLVSQQDHF